MASTIPDDKELISTFDSVFSVTTLNDKCLETGLRLAASLNYSLKTCLILKDNKWVVAVMDIDNLKHINDTTGYGAANIIIENVGTVIREFCQEKPMKTKGFRNSSIPQNDDMFAVLIRYSKKIENVETRINTLISRIFHVTNQTVSVGLAKMRTDKTNENETKWMQRAISLMKIVKNEKGGNGLETDIYENAIIINEEKEESNKKNNNSKHKHRIKHALGSQTELEEKGKEIAMLEDENWSMAIIDADNMHDFGVETSEDEASTEVGKIREEISNLCDILDGKCFGYQFGADEFGMIIYDDKNDMTRITSKEIVQVLIENVKSNCKLTISIGLTHYLADNEESYNDWFNRANRFLKRCKENGEGRVCWGQNIKELRQKANSKETESKLSEIDDNQEEDLLLMKSLEQIQVLLSFVLFLHLAFGVFFCISSRIVERVEWSITSHCRVLTSH